MAEVIARHDAAVNKKTGWHARLELAYKQTPNKTILSHRLHQGPLVIQKPFYPEGDVCHSYLIHPPGGIVGGDVLELDVVLHPQSHALVTTPAANKFYRSKKVLASLNQKINIKNNAVFEWLPQETIFYNQSQAAIHTEFDLDDQAKLICWEINCFGRPAGNEYFKDGRVLQKISITRKGIPLYMDRNVIEPESGILQSAWGLNNFPVMATMLAVFPAQLDSTGKIQIGSEALEKLQQHTAQYIFSMTQRDDLLLIRYLGYHAREALALFSQCWSIIRPQLLDKKYCPPRIWAT